MFGSFSERIGVVRSYARKREIIREDDPATRVYQVISGTVCTARMLRDGRRQVGGFYFSGDVFGLEATVKHTLAAQAITDVRVRIVKKQTLSALVLSDCKVADRLLSLTARELARKQSLALLLSRTAQERVIGFIIEMAQHGLSKGDRIALPMSRQDIADYLGLTIETVSRILHDLERRGAIKINGYRSIALRNLFVERKAEELPDLRLIPLSGRLTDVSWTSGEAAGTHVTTVHDQPCIHDTRDCIVSMHGAYAGHRR